MCPTIGVIENTFADKTNDSRYDGTFTTVYRGNWPKGGLTNAFVYNANSMLVYPGEPILTFLNEEPATLLITLIRHIKAISVQVYYPEEPIL